MSHHQSFVHEELLPWSAVIVLGVYSEAEEKDVHHDLKDGQEAVSHQEGEETHNDQRQQPLGIIPLVVQEEDTGEGRRGHNQDLKQTQVGPICFYMREKCSGNRRTENSVSLSPGRARSRQRR